MNNNKNNNNNSNNNNNNNSNNNTKNNNIDNISSINEWCLRMPTVFIIFLPGFSLFMFFINFHKCFEVTQSAVS